MSNINTLLDVMTRQLAATNDANELARERIEIVQKDSEANRSENRDMRATLKAQRTTLEAQQSALAALQSVSTKTAKLLKKNLESNSDFNLSSKLES